MTLINYQHLLVSYYTLSQSNSIGVGSKYILYIFTQNSDLIYRIIPMSKNILCVPFSQATSYNTDKIIESNLYSTTIHLLHYVKVFKLDLKCLQF